MDSNTPIPLAVDAKRLGQMLGLSRASVFAMHSAGKLPRPVRPTGRAPRWIVSDIEAWLHADCPPRDVWERLKVST